MPATDPSKFDDFGAYPLTQRDRRAVVNAMLFVCRNRKLHSIGDVMRAARIIIEIDRHNLNVRAQDQFEAPQLTLTQEIGRSGDQSIESVHETLELLGTASDDNLARLSARRAMADRPADQVDHDEAEQ